MDAHTLMIVCEFLLTYDDGKRRLVEMLDYLVATGKIENQGKEYLSGIFLDANRNAG